MGRAQLSDPGELRRFISTLQTFNTELQSRSSSLTGCWTNLQQVWRDSQCDRFAADWQIAVKAIEGYLRESDQYVVHLQEKLRQVEDGYGS